MQKSTLFLFIILCYLPFTHGAGIYTISENFNTGLPSNATLYGSASYAGSYIQLTPIAGSQYGGLSFTGLSGSCLVESWSAQFNFYAGGGSGADGFSLSFTRMGTVGAVGEWGTNAGVAIEFDTYMNPGDPNDNHIAILYDGSTLAQAASLPLNINSGQWHTARIMFDMGNIKVYLTPYGGTESLVLNYTISTWTSYAGQFNFGARTGGSTDLHAVDDFNATVAFVPEPGTLSLFAFILCCMAGFKRIF